MEQATTVDNVAFGSKTIGTLGSLAMLLNNILGPGIANFPGVFQSAGWLLPAVLVVACSLSSLASGEMLTMAMKAMPGNSNFERRVEYSTLCRHYFTPIAANVSVIIFLVAMMTANISNIIQTSHVFDDTIDGIFTRSCALEVYPSFFHFFCDHNAEDVTPFGTGKIVLSLGTSIVAVCSIPLSYWNLDDNIIFQNISLVFIVLSILLWILIFIPLGLEPDRAPFVRSGIGMSAFRGVGGTVLFNFMFISTLPSWICEKKPQIVAVRVISCTLFLAALMFMAVGLLGGMAFEEYYDTDNTLLSKLQHLGGNKFQSFVASASVDIYAVASNISSIPVFAIMLRYNIVEQRLLGSRAANFVSVVVPWALSIVLYTGSGFLNVVDFGGTFSSSIVNFIVPSLLFVASQRSRQVDMEGAPAPLVLEQANCTSAPSAATCAGPGNSFEVQRTAPAVIDRSGRITSLHQSKRWVRLAWLNVILMTGLTAFCILGELP